MQEKARAPTTTATSSASSSKPRRTCCARTRAGSSRCGRWRAGQASAMPRPTSIFRTRARCWPSWRRSASISFAMRSPLRVGRPLRSARAEFMAAAKAYIQFGTANPSLYRLMFSADVDKKAFQKLDEAGATAFAELLGILERGQQQRRVQEAAGARPGCGRMGARAWLHDACDRRSTAARKGRRKADRRRAHIHARRLGKLTAELAALEKRLG